MAKKKRTKAERRAAALASWARRKKGLPPTTPQKKQKGKARTKPVAVVADSDLPITSYITATPGYEMLALELQQAYLQSAEGKGRVRHANGRPFDRQPILELTRMYGPGFAAGQAAKKAQEALGMLRRGDHAAAIAELHGAIVYLAATAGHIREG
jgi:hypothetical protein